MTKEKSKEELRQKIADNVYGVENWGERLQIDRILSISLEYARQECDKIFEFAKWASHSDWTYLPSKSLWYNEEEEENITPKTTEQLYDLYKSKT